MKTICTPCNLCDSELFYNPVQNLEGERFLVSNVREDTFEGFEEMHKIYKSYVEMANETDLGASIWSDINVPEGESYLDIIRDNPMGMYILLNNMFRTPITTGFAQSSMHIAEFENNPDSAGFMYCLIFDKLLRLLSYLEDMPEYNPEQPYDFSSISSTDVNELMDRLQAKVNFDISAPKFQGGLFGIDTKYGIFTERHFTSIFNCLKITENFPNRNQEICEIGGGYGLQTFYLLRSGYKDISVIDIIYSSICFSHTLATNGIQINLFEYGSENVSVFLPQHLNKVSSKMFINIDFFPEMGSANLSQYINKILEKRARLFSVNQEAMATTFDGHQLRVSDEASKKLVRTHRNIDWMRKGYIIENWQAPEVLKEHTSHNNFSMPGFFKYFRNRT